MPLNTITALTMGERIRRRREALGGTRDEMAKALDCSVKFCADIENGSSGVSVKTLLTLSKFLKVSTDYLLTGMRTEEDRGELTRIVRECPAEKAPFLLEIVQAFLRSC